MLRRRPLADVVALWQHDPREREAALERLAMHKALKIVSAPPGWIVGLRCLPHTAVTDVYRPDCGLVVLQGADLLLTEQRREDWDAIQDDMISRTGYCAQKTDSDFAIVMLGAHGELRLFQTHVAGMPYYIAHSESALAFSSCLDLMALARAEAPEPDLAVSATWANGSPFHVEGRSLLRDVARLSRGTRTRAQPGERLSTQDASKELLGGELSEGDMTRSDVAQCLRGIVLTNLRRDLVSDGVNLLALSCGRDSTTLATLVHRHLRLPLATVSLLPADPAVRAQELRHAQSALHGLPCERRIVIEWPHTHYAAHAIAKAPSTWAPILHPILCEMDDLRSRTSAELYFGGDFVDELLGGEASLDEWLRDVGLCRALWLGRIQSQRGTIRRRTYLRRRFGRLDRMVSWLRGSRDARELPDYFHRELRTEVAALLKRATETLRADVSPSRVMLGRFRLNYSLALDMNWAACAHLGMRRAQPFLSRETLALLWRTRARHRLHPRTKELPCAAFVDLVPRAVLVRPDKGFWGACLPKGQPLERLRWGTLIRRPHTAEAVSPGLAIALAVEHNFGIRSKQVRWHGAPCTGGFS